MDLNDILKRQPWHIAYVNIGQRCTNCDHPKYKFYGGKGIKRSITSEELKMLYFRDKAYLMKSPSVDRMNSSKDYAFENCRYIEMDENRKLANDQRSGKLSVDQMRDLMCKLNRLSDRQTRSTINPKEIENMFSPPTKGEERRVKENIYPPQILGVRAKTDPQRIRVQGSTNGGSRFGDTSGGVFGIPTGGSYGTR
jgi:hypothetical protein